MSYPRKHQDPVNTDALFCPKCGTKTQRICGQCGSKIDDGDLFCPKCGVSLERSQFVSDGDLINVAEIVAHRINNALSIILTNSQVAERQMADLPQKMRKKLQRCLHDIAVTADGGGNVIRQFQKFLCSIPDEHLQEENSTFVDQPVNDLQLPVVSESRDYHTDMKGEKPTRIGNVSILIVDDEERIRHALSYALTLSGHHVITASDGHEALELFKNGSYDIAFVDLKMPRMNGWEVTNAIKQMDPDVMVVLMTGWSVRLDDERLSKNHVDAVLAKPFELSQINDLIKNVSSI